VRPLKITGTPDCAQSGDFHAEVTESELRLPQRLANVLTANGIRTAAEAVSFMDSFPSSIAHELQWNISDVATGVNRLRGQLKGVVDDSLLNPPLQIRRRVYGALNPRDMAPATNDDTHD